MGSPTLCFLPSGKVIDVQYIVCIDKSEPIHIDGVPSVWYRVLLNDVEGRYIDINNTDYEMLIYKLKTK